MSWFVQWSHEISEAVVTRSRGTRPALTKEDRLVEKRNSLFTFKQRVLRRTLAAGSLVGLALILIPQPSAQLAEQTRARRAEAHEVMWLKLDLAHDLLDAFFARDLDVINASSRELTELSRDQDWFTGDLSAYAVLAGEFRDAVNEMERSANDEDMDAARHSFSKALDACFACHTALDGGMQ